MFPLEVITMTHRAESNDNTLVKTYIMLPLVISAFERDAAIMSAQLRTPAPYVEVLRKAGNAAAADLRDVRAEMRSRGLKVYEQNRLDSGVEAKFLCRGYHERMLLLYDVITVQAAIHMRSYLGLDISEYKSHEEQHRRNSGRQASPFRPEIAHKRQGLTTPPKHK